MRLFRSPGKKPFQPQFSSEVKLLLDRSKAVMEAHQSHIITVDHLLLAILEDEHPTIAHKYLLSLPNTEEIKEHLIHAVKAGREAGKKFQGLSEEVITIIQSTGEAATRQQATEITSEHLLLGIANLSDFPFPALQFEAVARYFSQPSG